MFAVQDEITSAVVAAIHPAVADAELRRISSQPTGELGSMGGLPAWYVASRKGQCRPDHPSTAVFPTITQDASFTSPYAAMATAYALQTVAFAARTIQSRH